MDFDYNTLTLKTIKVDRIAVGPEWRTEKFCPAWRIISYSRIYFPVSGEGMVTNKGKTYLLKPGMMMLVPPFANASVCCPQKLCKYWTHFNALLPGTQTDIFFRYGECIEIDTSEKNDYYISLFEHLIKIENQPKKHPIDHFEYNSYLRLLLAPFLRFLPESPMESALPKAIELLQYIEENYSKKLTLNMLAEVACMHPNYLCNCFRKRMNMTVFEYIDRVRLHHALEYLRQGKMTISEIAERTGYSSLQAFSKNFRKVYTVSPRNYGSMENNVKQDIAAGVLNTLYSNL